MKTPEEILNLYKQRLVFYGPMHNKMRMIQSIYNGTFEVPLPDMEQNSMPSAPNLLAAGVDQQRKRLRRRAAPDRHRRREPNVGALQQRHRSRRTTTSERRG